jgi:hypothetical protein
VGIGFMFAPNHHPAMKNVAPVRKELGVRTMFNILGPLTNPASAPNILMGVFHSDLVGIQVRALQRLGAEHAVVVYGRDGMDEISLGAATLVGELKNGQITEYEIHPEDFGLPMASNRALRVDTPEQSMAMLRGVLDNEHGAARDIVMLNAGAALYAANVAGSMAEGAVAIGKSQMDAEIQQKRDELLAEKQRQMQELSMAHSEKLADKQITAAAGEAEKTRAHQSQIRADDAVDRKEERKADREFQLSLERMRESAQAGRQQELILVRGDGARHEHLQVVRLAVPDGVACNL